MGRPAASRARRTFRSRCPPARAARRARPDVRQVRATALDAPRRRAAGHHRRAARASGRRAARAVRRGAPGRRERARARAREALRRVRAAADRGGVDRPGASRRPPERGPRRGQGAAARRAAADRRRPRAALPGGPRDQGARPRPRLHRRARARRRVRAADPRRARLRARGTERRDVPTELPKRRARPRAEGVLDLLAEPRAHAGVHRRRAARRPADRDAARAPSASRAHDERRLDGDDLPGRLLPRRPAPRERARARRRHDRPRRLRRRRSPHRRGHDEADAHVHRRGAGAGRHAPEAALRPRRSLPAGSRGRLSRAHQRAVLPLLRREPRGDRPARRDPRHVRPHLLDEPAPADALSAARPLDRDARLGRRRALPGLQRLRGREAVRARDDDRALHAGQDREPGATRGNAL